MEYYDEDLPIDIMIIIFRALNSHLHIYATVFELYRIRHFFPVRSLKHSDFAIIACWFFTLLIENGTQQISTITLTASNILLTFKRSVYFFKLSVLHFFVSAAELREIKQLTLFKFANLINLRDFLLVSKNRGSGNDVLCLTEQRLN